MVETEKPSRLASQGVGGQEVLQGNKAGNNRLVPAKAAVRANGFRHISFLWEHPARDGRHFGRQSSLTFTRSAMFSNFVPVVVDAVWPDRIEIELRIEIQR